MTTDVREFVAVRPRLYAMALSLLKDAGEAEDIVQEAWLRWERADRTTVLNAAAYLAVTARRLAINVALSARHRHELPAGSWLPERADVGVGPEVAAERHEAVDAAIRLMLERLTPAERAAFLLRNAFGYPYHRISEVLPVSVAQARQLVCRARRNLAGGPDQPVDAATHRRLVRTFRAAAQSGDLHELEELLVTGMTPSSRLARNAAPAV
ncbi:sigma-70 family RNA polymerase sigma factor [Paractinoplanes maris]|uniref:sigma-70 family RNA polymerase sigma factor n=1 Tax=Paractinoplanes maris TaxID=1734446 RepID=UPI002020FD44|nr:sigma-70 family RNA polymerase sigma factor [Actinoplanes maris]